MINWKQNFTSSNSVCNHTRVQANQTPGHTVVRFSWMITHWIGLHSVQLPYDYLLLLLLLFFFFQRLNTANEEIIEVLLSKQQVSLASFMINFFQIIAFNVFLFLTRPFHFVSFLLHNSFPLCSFYQLYATFEPLVPRTLPHQGSS